MAPKKIIRFRTRVRLSAYLAGSHYLEIPVKIVRELGTYNVRLICRVNGTLEFQCGLMALGKGRGLINLSRKRMNELEVDNGSAVEVELRLDSSRYGAAMPPELKEVLGFDDDGTRRFEALTPGKRRYIIQYVAAVKSVDRRIERAMLLIENLKKTAEGKETFREMLGLSRKRETPPANED